MLELVEILSVVGFFLSCVVLCIINIFNFFL